MAAGGADDIFIAYPMVGWFRVKRALCLAASIKRLILAIDSLEGAQKLQQAACETGQIVEVRIEVDTGAKRTGIAGSDAARLAEEISAMPNLLLTGIFTFKGLVVGGMPTTENEEAGREEGQLLKEAAAAIQAKGIVLTDVSGGSSPTAESLAKTGCVTVMRPGTYIFKDYMMCLEHAAKPEEIAARYYATVVSTPSKSYAVIDGGSKTFPMDTPLDMPPFYFSGYGVVEGREDLQLRRMNEEHGMLTSATGETRLRVGDVIALLPNHVCTAVNMQNVVYIYDGKTMVQKQVEARGMTV